MRNSELEKLHRQLAANYPAHWDEATDELCKRILTQLAREIGETRTVRAVMGCMASEQFFNEANLRKHIPEAMAVHNRCARCENSDGWIEIQIPGRKTPSLMKCNHDGAMRSMSSGANSRGQVFRNGWSG